ncbi:lipocalin-like domain-containing protein [Streptomyces sp. TRM66268-LWL]|uniref:Lipocalin-like domain-containing protein n=1 Tax=Streptomyces polyasparticus TaxID=2767826 RepID=A0ABR7SVV5_9ACTN|nr:lipocalin-like domain-containing protein [Streptomyces polyasparticus]
MTGAWQLVSYTATGADGVTHPLGTDPQGLLIYTPQGQMSAQVSGAGIYMGYAGTYEWHGDRVVHHTIVGSAPEWEGVDLPRSAECAGGLLILRADPSGGRPALAATWQRPAPTPHPSQWPR